MLRRGQILTAIIVALISSSSVSPASTNSYDDITTAVQKLKASKLVVAQQIGSSKLKRPIYAVTLTSQSNDSPVYSEKPRVLVLCVQHGNEPLPAAAALELMQSMASTKDPQLNQLLKKSVVAFVPVVNPDGYVAGKRYNAAGADLNRNWKTPDQPETLAVTKFIDQFRPQVLIDEHEWVDGDPYRPNCIEVAHYGHDVAFRFARMLTYYARMTMNEQHLPMRSTYYTEQSDPRMAHRRFADSGICSILVETSSDWQCADRIRAYRSIVVSILHDVSTPPDQLAARDINILQKKHQLAAVRSESHISQHTPQPGLPNGSIYCLVAAVIVLTIVRATSCKGTMNKTDIKPGRKAASFGRAFSITDAVRSDASVRTRLSMIQCNKPRPTDRSSNRSDSRSSSYAGLS